MAPKRKPRKDVPFKVMGDGKKKPPEYRKQKSDVPRPEDLVPPIAVHGTKTDNVRWIVDKNGVLRSIPKNLGMKKEYDGTSESVYIMNGNPKPEDLDEAVTKALLPDLDPGDVALSIREARYMGARVVGLTKGQSVAYADGNMDVSDRAAVQRSNELERNAAGAIQHVRRHVAMIATELLREGLSIKDMANLAVSTFAEVASNASGVETTKDRLVAAANLGRIAGLYEAKAPETPDTEQSEDALKAQILDKLNVLMRGASAKQGLPSPKPIVLQGEPAE